MDRSQKLGEGSIPYLLLTFSVPAIVGMLAQALYYNIDRIFVGRALGWDGIAGITVAFPFMLIMMAFSMLIGFGAAALVSIRLGQRKKAEAEQVLGNAVVLLAAMSIVLTAVGLWLLDPLLKLFGASAAVLPYAHDYLQIIVLGAVFQAIGFGLNAVIRGEGNPRIAMLTMLISVLLNLILAPIFIFGLGWGMRGAALATVASQAVSAAWVLGYFLRGNSLLKIHARNLRPWWPICTAVVAAGSPQFAIQITAVVINIILIQQLSIYGGDLAISVWGIIWAVAMMIFMPIFGINQAAQPIIGYNYGAQRFDRVKKALQTAVLAATGIALVGFAVGMLSPAQVIRLFSRKEEYQAVAALGSRAMRICLMTLPVVGFQIVGANYFQAVGKPKQAAFLSLSRQVLILIPAVFLLPRFFGLFGVWAAIPTADLGASLLTAVWLFLELRHLHRRHAEKAEYQAVGIGD
jgi:putative MATE family efflux protein